MEAILLSFLGAVVGLVFVHLLTLFSFHAMNFVTFSEVVIHFKAAPIVIVISLIVAVGMGLLGGSRDHFKAAPIVIVISLIVAVGMGLLGGVVPAIRASRISPVAAMRG